MTTARTSLWARETFGFTSNAAIAVLEAETFAGELLQGTDTVNIVP